MSAARNSPARAKRGETLTPLSTLPDLLRHGLDVIFVGINPSLFSAAQGRYFARRTNRFWPCLSHSILSRVARAALGVEQLVPEDDRRLLDYGFGFTDLAKRPTAKAAELTPPELAVGVMELLVKIERFAPRIACIHGVTAYRPIHRIIAPETKEAHLGLQTLQIASTRVFVVPNPSSANAHFTPADQTGWYDRLAEYLDEMRGGSHVS